MKSNFNTKKPSTIDELRKPIEEVDEQKGELNEKEFEELVSKTGAASNLPDLGPVGDGFNSKFHFKSS